jgi:hypothetical protein
MLKALWERIGLGIDFLIEAASLWGVTVDLACWLWALSS